MLRPDHPAENTRAIQQMIRGTASTIQSDRPGHLAIRIGLARVAKQRFVSDYSALFSGIADWR
jgi:hypothetical protein